MEQSDIETTRNYLKKLDNSEGLNVGIGPQEFNLKGMGLLVLEMGKLFSLIV